MGYSVFQAGRHGIVEPPAWPVREVMISDFDIATISSHSLAGVEQVLDVYFVRTAAITKRATKKRIAWETRERARAAKKNGK